jgi:hypothetical protein
VETIEQTLPLAPAGPAGQVLSVDGAMGPLVHQEWAEVKTLALGTVGRPVCEGGEWVVHTQERSYVSRLSDAETFGRMALVETHRGGGRDGADGVSGERWGRVDPGLRGPPPVGCGAYPGFSPCARVRGPSWAGGVRGGHTSQHPLVHDAAPCLAAWES